MLEDPTQPLIAEWFGSLPERVLATAQANPTAIAISDRYGDWTYAQVDQASGVVAAEMVRWGVVRGDTVAIISERSGALVWTLLGIMRLGAVFCILDPSHPARRLGASLQVVAPKLVVLATPADNTQVVDWLGAVPAMNVLRLPATPTELGASPLPPETWPAASPILPDDTAYLALTSGSTGAPRVVQGTHRPLSHFFAWYTRAFDFGPADRFSAISGLGHDPLLRDIFTPLLVGARVCFPPQLAVTSADLARWVAETEITVMHGTPAHIDVLATSASVLLGGLGQHLPSIRYFFSGGDVLTTRALTDLYATAPNVHVVNFYGATETPQAVAWLDVGTQERPVWRPNGNSVSVPIGRGIPGVQLLVMDSVQRLSPSGVEGEIYVRTPYLASAYVNEASLSAEKFLADPFLDNSSARLFRTGDAGIAGADGLIHFSRRLGSQVKVRGFRVEPADVEQALRRCSDVRQCAVLVEVDAQGESRLVAYVVARSGTPGSHEALRAQLASLLPSYMIPSTFTWLAALPHTPSGKIDRSALGEVAKQRRTPGKRSEALTTPTQRRLAIVWKELLGVERVRLHDDFFDLGGHSLIAVQLFVRIEQLWGLRLPLATLLHASTLASMAVAIEHPGDGSEWFSLVPIQPLGRRAPLYCIHGLFGDVLTFVDLARALGDDQPTFGLQARGLDGVQEPSNQVEAMASMYVSEIRQRQPDGPYQLLGFSSGGLIAYEMARQLSEMGQQVGFLGILDEAVPTTGASQTPLKPRLLVENALVNIPYWADSFRHSTWEDRTKMLRDRLRQLATTARRVSQTARRVLPAPGLDDRQFEDFIKPFVQMEDMAYVRSWPEYRRRLVKAQLRAATRYRPLPYPLPVTLLRARRQPLLHRFERDMGWSRLVGKAVLVVVVPGSHRRMIAPPYVKELAARLRPLLEQEQNSCTRRAA